MKFEEIISKLDESIFTPALKEEVTKAFNEAVDAKVKQIVDLEVENALVKMDEDCSEKLKTLLDKMDLVHTSRLDTLVSAMDRDFTKKLYTVYEKYNAELHENATALRNFFESAISQYLDAYLDEAFPANVVQEAVENTKAAKILSQIREVVGLDTDFMSESVKGAIKAAHDKIESLTEANQSLTEANKSLKDEADTSKARLFLESKLANANPDKREFFLRRLSGKTAAEVQSNYEYVEEMYKRDFRERRQALRESAEKGTVTFRRKLDPSTRLVESREERPVLNPVVAAGLEGLQE